MATVGTTWQALHSTAFERAPATCERWTPTPAFALAVKPYVSGAPEPVGAAATFASWPAAAGGAAPTWQVVQVSPCVSIAPLMCLPLATAMAPVASTVPPWHFVQVVTADALWWLAVPGCALWQLPHVDCVPFTVVHTGVAALPRVVAVRFQAGAALPSFEVPPKVSVAKVPSM